MLVNFGLSVRQRRGKAGITCQQLADAIHMTWERLDSIEAGQQEATDEQKRVIHLALRRLGAMPHLPDCLCPTCERTGSGQFAVRAFMAGDDSAASRLSSAVVEALLTQRARSRRRLAPHSASPYFGAKCHGGA